MCAQKDKVINLLLNTTLTPLVISHQLDIKVSSIKQIGLGLMSKDMWSAREYNTYEKLIFSILDDYSNGSVTTKIASKIGLSNKFIWSICTGRSKKYKCHYENYWKYHNKSELKATQVAVKRDNNTGYEKQSFISSNTNGDINLVTVNPIGKPIGARDEIALEEHVNKEEQTPPAIAPKREIKAPDGMLKINEINKSMFEFDSTEQSYGIKNVYVRYKGIELNYLTHKDIESSVAELLKSLSHGS